MKINVEFDLTPAEFRQAMGLPDVDAFQRDLMSRIHEQMDAGAEGYDPWNLMQPFFQQGMTQGMSSFGNYQQMMLDMLRQAGNQHSSASNDKQSDSASDSSASASATSRKGRKS